MTVEDRASVPAYIARCKGCGAVRAAIVDDPEATPEWTEEVARFCADTVRTGKILERTTVSRVRVADWECRKPGDPQCQRVSGERAFAQTDRGA